MPYTGAMSPLNIQREVTLPWFASRRLAFLIVVMTVMLAFAHAAL